MRQILHQILQVKLIESRRNKCKCVCVLGTVFGLCQTIGAAGLLAANYVVTEGLHGSVIFLKLKIIVL